MFAISSADELLVCSSCTYANAFSRMRLVILKSNGSFWHTPHKLYADRRARRNIRAEIVRYHRTTSSALDVLLCPVRKKLFSCFRKKALTQQCLWASLLKSSSWIWHRVGADHSQISISVRGWDKATSGFGKRTAAILEFYFRFRFRPMCSHWHAIL